MRTTRMRSPLAHVLAAVIVAGTLLAPAQLNRFGATPAHAACEQSRAILLQGLGTDSSYGTPYFADILNAIGGSYSGTTYFSYNLNNPQLYSNQDSLQSISRSVEALHRAVAREIAACDGVGIDLIGHSNGGVVALRYLATYGPSTAEGSHIRHLVTLDSPVNGLSVDYLTSLAQSAALFGIDLSYLQSTDAIRDLVAAFNDPATTRRNVDLARSLSGKVGVLTMGSDSDLVVPFPSASIQGFSSEWSLGLISNLCPTYVDACVGHNQILHDPGVIAKIASFVGATGGGGRTSSSSSTGCNGWSGAWNTDFGRMQLSLSGNSATGTYETDGGKISGMISGSTLRGTWSEQPSYRPPDDSGDFQFTLDSNGTSFSGEWRYGSSGDWSPWNGTCAS